MLVAPRGALRRRHRPRAQHASVGRCTATSWTDLGVGAHLLRSASASRRAAKGARRSMGNGEIVLSRSVLRCAWSRPQRGGGARGGGSAKKRREVVRNKGGPSQYPEKSATLAFFQVPRIYISVGFLVLTVKRDTQKERTTKSRKSWGAKAVRVRATGSPRAHPPEVVGHGRRSQRFRNPLIGALRGR